MAKLYFRYGTMNSAKTLNLLAVVHNYQSQGKKTLLLKPAFESRFGVQEIRSRAGLSRLADFLIDEKMDLLQLELKGVSCLIVDEAHFLSAKHIEQLRLITIDQRVPVICYGLRTDFRTYLFEGSQRLMELADSIEELKTICHYCERKACVNMRHVAGRVVLEGPTVVLGAEDAYFAVCFSCYISKLREAKCNHPLAL